jgi:malonate transporter and related proteins
LGSFDEIASVIVPVYFVLLLGYLAGRAKKFDSDQVQGINELVLDFALPAALFVGTISTTRSLLLQLGPFFAVTVASMLGMYVVGLVIARAVFHLNLGAAGLFAISSSFPAAPFYGTAILSGLYGASSATAIAVVAIVGNIVIVPTTLVLLESAQASQGQSAKLSRGAIVRQSLKNAIRAPVFFAPVIGIVLVLLGISLPSLAASSLSLIGGATSGVALFVAGVIIAAFRITLKPEVVVASIIKMVALPAVFMAFALAVSVNHQLGSEGFILSAIASAVVATMLATRYKTFQGETSSILALTSVLMVAVLPIAIYLTGAA